MKIKNKNNKQRKFYIVFKVSHIVIYSSWEECTPYILGYSGSLYRSFKMEYEPIAEFNVYFEGKLNDKDTSSDIEVESYVASSEVEFQSKRKQN